MVAVTRLDQQIQTLETEVSQKRARLSKLKARKSQRERKENRAADTRRKILVGAVILKKAENQPEFAAELNRWLHEGLTQERDREMFPDLTQKK